MAREVNYKETTRAKAFELWMKAPNPMVTFFKTLDVSNLIKISKKKKLKFNMLLDYCIGKAAVSVKEFYILPVGNQLMQYDTIAINTIVKNKEKERFLIVLFCSWKTIIINFSKSISSNMSINLCSFNTLMS